MSRVITFRIKGVIFAGTQKSNTNEIRPQNTAKVLPR